MLKNLSIVAVTIFGTATASASTNPFENYKMQGPPPPITEEVATNSSSQPFSIIQETPTEPQKTTTQEVVPEKPKVKRLVCKGCNDYESKTLAFLQDNGVTDRNALATIMGNIRQESTFFPNICEGGARVPYHSCRSGGYGALQWTDSSRYNGLGQFAAKFGGDPSSMDTQLRYMINEYDWKMIEPYMKRPGGSINDYMRLARKWIRWGHHGARTDFAYNYANRLVMTEI